MAKVKARAVPFYCLQLPIPRKFAASASTSLVFPLLTSMPRFISINFYQNRPKIKLFLSKTTILSSAQPQTPATAPVIADFWLRACLVASRVFNLIANVNKQLIAYFGQTQLIAIL